MATQGDANWNSHRLYAATGFDLATGLGSVNACNLANNFAVTNPGGAADFSLSNCVALVSVPAAGGSGTLNLTVTAINGFSGTFNFTPSSCTGLRQEPHAASVPLRSLSIPRIIRFNRRYNHHHSKRPASHRRSTEWK